MVHVLFKLNHLKPQLIEHSRRFEKEGGAYSGSCLHVGSRGCQAYKYNRAGFSRSVVQSAEVRSALLRVVREWYCCEFYAFFVCELLHFTK